MIHVQDIMILSENSCSTYFMYRSFIMYFEKIIVNSKTYYCQSV